MQLRSYTLHYYSLSSYSSERATSAQTALDHADRRPVRHNNFSAGRPRHRKDPTMFEIYAAGNPTKVLATTTDRALIARLFRYGYRARRAG